MPDASADWCCLADAWLRITSEVSTFVNIFSKFALKLRESCAGQRDIFVRTCPDDTEDLRYKPALYTLAQSPIFHLLLKTNWWFWD